MRLPAWLRRAVLRCDADGCKSPATTEATYRLTGKALVRHYCECHAKQMADAVMAAEMEPRS